MIRDDTSFSQPGNRTGGIRVLDKNERGPFRPVRGLVKRISFRLETIPQICGQYSRSAVRYPYVTLCTRFDVARQQPDASLPFGAASRQ